MSYTKTTWVNNTTPINETNLNKIESGIENNDINIGEENYDNTRTYEVGDIVRYNEKIYKCITAITTAENFDSSKWEQTNIVEIVQSEKSKIYELIEALSTPIVGEGENITLNDTAEKRFEEFEVNGNSKQETRSGKNLIDESNISEAASSEGIRYNGSYVYDNTPNSDSRGWSYDNCNYFLSLPAGTYTLSLNFKKRITDNTGGLFRFYKTDNTFIGNLSGLNVDYASVSITLTETTNLGLYFKLMDGQVNIQIEEGSTATPYEQYGVSPSPDYPSEVKSCGDNINELNNTATTQTINGLTVVVNDDKTIKINGTATANTLLTIGTMTFIANQQYYASGCPSGGTSSTYRLDYRTANEAVDFTEYGTGTIINKTQDTTLTAKIRIENGYACDNLLFKPKITKGSIATEYSEYGQGCVKVTIGNKNLINIEEVKWGAYYMATGALGTSLNWGTIKVKALGNTKYYLSGNKVSNNTACVVLLDKNKEFIKVVNNYTNTHLITTTSDTCYIGISIPKYADGSSGDDTTTIMLEEKEILTSYEEHQSQSYTIPTQQPFRSVGNTRDTFIKKNNKWYEHHPIVRIESYNGETITSEYISNTGELSTGATVDYISDTPVDIECTEEQSTILFDIEQNAKTYKGVTHIYSNDEVSPNCYVEAVKDLTTLIQ